MHKTTDQIRQDFLRFFQKKGHVIIPSSTLVPYKDSSLLFTNAGMNQFKEIFLNQKKSDHSRVVTIQRCLRTGGKHNDLENVGYTEKHHTFFEMLGNFSFGDYFKKEAIQYAWELLTSKKWFNIPKNKLCVSVYKNDHETYEIWKNIIKISPQKIILVGDKNESKYHSENFWQMSENGPCGPCTEIFYDYEEKNTIDPLKFLCDKNNRFIEIWNIVFIEFNRVSKNQIVPLKNKSIDTGMGLERISTILQNVRSNYKIDIFRDLIKKISNLSNQKYLNDISLKIIADHIRSSSYIISENIIPTNEKQGYVLRKIIRRALVHGRKIGMPTPFFYKLVSPLINIMKDKLLIEKKETIKYVLKEEEMQFSKTLDQGLKQLHSEIEKIKGNTLSGDVVFYLYDTFGFPVDLTSDFCREKNIQIDYIKYEKYKKKQKIQSHIKNKLFKNNNIDISIQDECIFQGYKKYKINALVKHIFIDNIEKKEIKKHENGVIFLNTTSFYGESGGQIGDIGQIYSETGLFKVKKTKKYGNTIGHIGKIQWGKIKINDCIHSEIDQNHRFNIELNHSGTHLLHSALKKFLGKNVNQKGSLVTDQGLRFDFSYSKSFNTSDIKNIEKIINVQIRKNIPIKIETLTLDQAQEKKAIALFHEKYSTLVRVVSIKNFSIELCGGTHTKRTGNIGLFKITSCSSIASGIKRIEAVTGQKAIDYIQRKEQEIHDISSLLNCSNSDVIKKINTLNHKIKNLENKINILQKQEISYYVEKLNKYICVIKEKNFLFYNFHNYEHKLLRIIVDHMKLKIKNAIMILLNIKHNSFSIIIGVTQDLIHNITAIQIMNIFMNKINGQGGGKKELAEGGGAYTEKIYKMEKYIKSWIHATL